MNCDHSMLTYSCYKEPASILKLFRIRLREIMKINLLPASVMGAVWQYFYTFQAERIIPSTMQY